MAYGARVSRRWVQGVAWGLVLISLLLGWAPRPAWADEGTGGQPTAIPDGTEAESASAVTRTVYLPQIRGTSGVDIRSRQSVLAFYRLEYQQAQDTTAQWTGNHAACDPGTTDSPYRQALGRRLNFFRAMAGVPANVSFSADANRAAQAAALMMSANRALSHEPPTTWLCYSSEGASGAGTSNLYLSTAPRDPVTDYMRDAGAGNAALGHRRWLLYPQTQTMGTGDVPPVDGYPMTNALVVFDSQMWQTRPAVRDGYVAWPPAGYTPYTVIFPRWSFSYPNADFSGATVSMSRGGASVTVQAAAPVAGFGENTLVWIPQGLGDGDPWPRPAADTTYAVTVRNVIINGQARTFTYSVIVFDPGT